MGKFKIEQTTHVKEVSLAVTLKRADNDWGRTHRLQKCLMFCSVYLDTVYTSTLGKFFDLYPSALFVLLCIYIRLERKVREKIGKKLIRRSRVEERKIISFGKLN